jgi:hypothetical protein
MKEYLMCIYQNDPTNARIGVKSLFRAFYPQEEAEHNSDLSHNWVKTNFGIEPNQCNKYVFSYVASLLFQMSDYGVTYLEDSDRRIAQLSVSHSQVVVESFVRLFAGNTFKIPVTFALISIGNRRIVGVRASCFSISAVLENIVFMPISMQVYREDNLELIAQSAKSSFGTFMKLIDASFLSITEELFIESVSKRAEPLLNFHCSHMIPFEHFVEQLKRQSLEVNADNRLPSSPTMRQLFSLRPVLAAQMIGVRKVT